MAIPSESDFHSYFSVANWVPQAEWIEKAETIEPNFESIKALLREIEYAKEKHFKAANDHDVVKWLYSQPSVKRAWAVLRGRKNSGETISDEEYLNRKTQRFVDYYSERKSDSYSWRFSLQKSIARTPLGVWNDVIISFFEYFHTDRWLKTLEMGRDSKKTLKRVIEAYDAIENLQSKMDLMQEFYLGHGRLQLGMGKLVGDRREKFVQILQSAEFVFPTTRNDETAKERMLVFDLSRLFRRNYRSDKPSAIFHLLMTEGVAHTLDQRTIERMLEQWRNKKNEINRRLPEK